MSLTTLTARSTEPPPAPMLPGGDGREPERRRILVVAPELPSPPTWGFALRVHHLASHLAELHEVRLLAYGTPGSVERVPGVFEAVTLVAPPPAPAKRAGQLASVASPLSYHLHARRSDAMQRALDAVVARWSPDVVQIESSVMSWLRVPKGPVVALDEHNIESELMERIARVEAAPVRAAFGRLEAWKVHREELLAWERADGVALTSAREEEMVRRRLPDAWTCVVPNGVDLDGRRPAGDAAVDPDRLVFVGSINYRPNTDAVRYMVREVLPLIRSRRPRAVLTVVGQGVPGEVARLRAPGVEFTGRVDDVRPFVAGAAAVVVPLRIGGGTRLKVLEALAMAKAVVTTSIGCEGIAAGDREHLLVADDPVAFADRVLEVLTDPELRCSLGTAGRELTERLYGWQQAAGRLDAFHKVLRARTNGG